MKLIRTDRAENEPNFLGEAFDRPCPRYSAADTVSNSRALIGLGLAVSRNWVSRHGGALRIESTVGKGTTAKVSLPLRRVE